MRLVVVTQAVDRDDPVLGATVAKLDALASRCDELRVLSLRVGTHDLPANVRVVTFGARTRIGRGFRYAAALASALRNRPDAVLAHMCPIYLVLAAPLAKPIRVPLLLWYTHWAASRTLRTAERLADAVLSVDRRSLPLRSTKLRELGHGIDTGELTPRPEAPDGADRLRLLALGRTSPTKGLGTILDGVELALARGVDVTLELRGPSSNDAERRYRTDLEQRVSHPPLAGRVRLGEPVPRGEVPALLRGFDALVNAHPGTLDKVVYEAAACAVPAVAPRETFGPFLDGLDVPLAFGSKNAEELAGVLAALSTSTREQRTAVGRELRRRVESGHSAETWAEGVIGVIRELRARARSEPQPSRSAVR